MKLELSIANDTELRQFIRESIKNEIVHIARQEISDVIKECLAKSTKMSNLENTVDKLLREEANRLAWHHRPNVGREIERYTLEKLKPEIDAVLTPGKIAEVVENKLRSISLVLRTEGTSKVKGNEIIIGY